MIVLDANILVRAVLGRRVRQLLETYSSKGVRFIAPEVAFKDVERYLPSLLKKFSRHDIEIAGSVKYLHKIIETIEKNIYSAFETEARERLRGRDENDWPVLASALALDCAVWTEDADFFGTGIAVWTSNRIEIFLEAQVSEDKTERE